MNRIDAINVLALSAALALALGAGSTHGSRAHRIDVARGPQLTGDVAAEQQADGSWALRDASGTLVPLERYTRIASATLLADRILADLCEPTRIVAYSSTGVTNGYAPYRLAGKPAVDTRAGIEPILQLKPDLMLVSELVDPAYLARLRERGIAIFDLGHMRGLVTLLPSIRALGILLGEPERAEIYAQNLAARMRRVARDLAPERRPRALYLATYADKFYGGAARTSYHDVLVHAGLRDVAAEAGLSGWPTLSTERVLALDPQVIVTKIGMGALLCRHAGLAASAPCRGAGRIVELQAALLDDPGPAMLEATEVLYRTVWGSD
jgi:iron complex transport system substrate-binding protein